MGDEDVFGRVDVDAVSAGAALAVLVVADGEAVDGDVVRVADVEGPEAGAAEERARNLDVGGLEDLTRRGRLAS